MRKAGSRPSRSRTKAIIAAVVVLPCAPATTIAREADELGEELARGFARRRDPANAVETTASSRPEAARPSEISTGIPAART